MHKPIIFPFIMFASTFKDSLYSKMSLSVENLNTASKIMSLPNNRTPSLLTLSIVNYAALKLTLLSTGCFKGPLADKKKKR